MAEAVAPDALRERAAMLEIAIDDHAAREEQQLFAPLCAALEENAVFPLAEQLMGAALPEVHAV